MKKPTLIGLNFILLSFFMTCVKAGELGPLTYTNNTLYVTITDCASNASGSITVPNTIEGVKVTKIGNQAFSTCRKITSIKLGNNITDISFGAFWGCEKLESINIPNRVTNIGARAFSGCGKLESINIPQGISIIRGATFANCIELKEIIIPDTVETIEEDAFRLTYKLSEIVIPNKVTELPESAFYESGLEKITIGKNVSNIKRNALSCRNLGQIYFEGDAPNYDPSSSFSNVESAVVFVSPSSNGFGETFAGFPVITQVPNDRDNDGVADTKDAFPDDPTETVDSDGDGVGDNGDAFPNYKGESADSDGNGIGDNAQSSLAKTEEINTLQAQINELLARPTVDQLAALEAERDARPTKAAYDAVVAERDAKPTLDEIKDGRLGSIVITPIPNTNTAILNIDIEQSDDLKTWTLYRKILESIPLPEGKKFYRFALDK